jgi:alpha-galactosidase
VSTECPIEIWTRPLADNSKAVGVFNRLETLLSAIVNFLELGFQSTVTVLDIWQAKDLGQMNN